MRRRAEESAGDFGTRSPLADSAARPAFRRVFKSRETYLRVRALNQTLDDGPATVTAQTVPKSVLVECTQCKRGLKSYHVECDTAGDCMTVQGRPADYEPPG